MTTARILWRDPAPLLLASTSETRRTLLASAGLPVETEAPGVDERAIEDEATGRRAGGPDCAARLARRLACEKALAVSRRRPGRVVVGADQTLACEERLFHKPSDRAAAEAQLAALAGRTHTLHAGVAVARDGGILHESVDVAHLRMRPLAADDIALYAALAGERVTASVGAYRIEGLGIHLFEEVEGAHSTILGLPLLPLLAGLRGLGLLAL
jgi:septum formation protein